MTTTTPAATGLDLFTTLLSKDPQWRGRLLKTLQYAARLVALTHEAKRGGALLALLPPAVQMSQLASSLSTARRGSALFDAFVYVRDAAVQLQALRDAHSLAAGKQQHATAPSFLLDLAASPRTLSAVLNAFAGVADDLSTAGSFGLFPSRLLPAWFEPLHARLWATQCAFSLYFSVVALVRVRDAWAVSHADVASEIDSGALHTLRSRIAEGRAAAHALDHAIAMARLNVLKAACDVCQSLPHGLQRGHLLPAWADVSLGLASALLAVARVWSEASVSAAAAVAAGQAAAVPPEEEGEEEACATSPAGNGNGSASYPPVEAGGAVSNGVSHSPDSPLPTPISQQSAPGRHRHGEGLAPLSASAVLAGRLSALPFALSPIARRDEADAAAATAVGGSDTSQQQHQSNGSARAAPVTPVAGTLLRSQQLGSAASAGAGGAGGRATRGSPSGSPLVGAGVG